MNVCTHLSQSVQILLCVCMHARAWIFVYTDNRSTKLSHYLYHPDPLCVCVCVFVCVNVAIKTHIMEDLKIL